MIIAQISDSHIALDSEDSDQRIRDLEAVISDINALDPAPDLIIHSGDIVHNGLDEEYAVAADLLANANVPVYAMVGNKDRRGNMRKAFSAGGYVSTQSEFIEYRIGSFQVDLVILDTLSEGSNLGELCAKRLNFLEFSIDHHNAKPTAIFMHHPPCEINVGPHPIHFKNPNEMDAFRATLETSNQVVSIFTGHVHRSTMGRVGNVPVTVMSAVATSLRRGDYPDHMKRKPTYSIHRYDTRHGFVSETRIVDY